MARRSAHRRVFDPMDILGTRRAREVRWAKVVLLALAGHAAREVEGGFSPWCTADDIPGGVGSLWQTPFCGWVKTSSTACSQRSRRGLSTTIAILKNLFPGTAIQAPAG